MDPLWTTDRMPSAWMTWSRPSTTSRPSTASRSPSARASSSACSARTGRARRRPSTCSRRSCGRPRARRPSPASTSAADRDDVRKSIGIVFQEPALDGKLTGRENLEFHTMMYGIGKAERRRRIDEVLALVELADKAATARREVFGRHEAAARDRPRPDPPAQGPLPRRADARPGRPDPPPHLGVRPQAQQGGRGDHHPDHPLHGGGRLPLRPHRHHGPRQVRGPGHAGPAQGHSWAATSSPWSSRATRRPSWTSSAGWIGSSGPSSTRTSCP